MDTKKTSTQEESLNSSTTAKTPTDEELRFCDSVVYSLYEEAVDELFKQSEAEKAEYNELLARFAKREGVKKESPYVMMYAGFYMGIGKGLEFVARLENMT